MAATWLAPARVALPLVLALSGMVDYTHGGSSRGRGPPPSRTFTHWLQKSHGHRRYEDPDIRCVAGRTGELARSKLSPKWKLRGGVKGEGKPDGGDGGDDLGLKMENLSLDGDNVEDRDLPIQNSVRGQNKGRNGIMEKEDVDKVDVKVTDVAGVKMPEALQNFLVANQVKVREALAHRGIITSPGKLQEILKSHDLHVSLDDATIMWNLHNHVKMNQKYRSRPRTQPLKTMPEELKDSRMNEIENFRKAYNNRISDPVKDERTTGSKNNVNSFEAKVTPEDAEATPAYSFTIVKIPCDDLLPVQELTVRVPAGTSPNTDYLKDVYLLQFLDKRPIDNDAVEAAWGSMMGRGIGDHPDLFSMKSGSYETVVLCSAMPENNNTATQVYVDEISVLKALPQNLRATAILEAVGKGTQPLQGDVFVGRIKISESGAPQGFQSLFMKELKPGSELMNLGRKSSIEENKNQMRIRELLDKKGVKSVNVGDPKATEPPAEPQDEQEMTSCRDFRWRQSSFDVEIYVKVPMETRSKDCIVRVDPRQIHIRVMTKRERYQDLTINLLHPIHSDTSTWTLSKELSTNHKTENTTSSYENGFWKFFGDTRGEEGEGPRYEKQLTVCADKVDQGRWTFLERSYRLPDKMWWRQTQDEVIIVQSLPENMNPRQIYCKFKETMVHSYYHGQEVFSFEGLRHNISAEDATWQIYLNETHEGIAGNLMELHLPKRNTSIKWADLGTETNPESIMALKNFASSRNQADK